MWEKVPQNKWKKRAQSGIRIGALLVRGRNIVVRVLCTCERRFRTWLEWGD